MNKVFAGYLGREFINKHTLKPHRLTGVYLDTIYNKDEYKLLLTPYSKITDEDKIKVALMAGYSKNLEICGEDFCLSRIKSLPFMIYQFLQSRGYDLPSWYLDDQTVIEAGYGLDKTLM